MTKKADTFAISGFMRFYLIIQIAAPITLLILMAWMLQTSSLELHPAWGPFGLLMLVAWTIHGCVKIAKWFNFSVELDEEGIRSGDLEIRWKDVREASAKPSLKFDTFIEIADANGGVLKVPAAIQKNTFVLSIVESHVPDLARKA